MILNTLDSSVSRDMSFKITISNPMPRNEQCSLVLSDSVQSPRLDRNQSKFCITEIPRYVIMVKRRTCKPEFNISE